MTSAVRDGDVDSAGDTEQGGASTVFVNGKKAYQPGFRDTCSNIAHPKDVQGTVVKTVYVEGKLAVNSNSPDSAGHKPSGSPNVHFE